MNHQTPNEIDRLRPPMPPTPAPPPKPQPQPRWGWILVPCVAVLAIGYLQAMDPPIEWIDVLRSLRVRYHGERFSQAVCLALGLLGILAVVRVLRRG